MLKGFFAALIKELREADTLLRRAGLLPNDTLLHDNYLKYGPSFGAESYDAFRQMAKDFYKEGRNSENPAYIVIEPDDKRIAIDYNGEIRGIYTLAGKPLAFFRPNFHHLGYSTKEQELEAFRTKVAFRVRTDKLYY